MPLSRFTSVGRGEEHYSSPKLRPFPKQKLPGINETISFYSSSNRQQLDVSVHNQLIYRLRRSLIKTRLSTF